MARSRLRKRVKNPDVACLFAMVGLVAVTFVEARAQESDEPQKRALLQQVYQTEQQRYPLGRREVYLEEVGLQGDYAWCAAFVSWCFAKAGFEKPRSPWSPSLLPRSRQVWQSTDGSPKGKMQVGDVFGIYIQQKKRIGHVGFVDGVDTNWIETVEGNTTGPDRGAVGVYRKRRPWRTVRAVADWIKDNPHDTKHIFFNP